MSNAGAINISLGVVTTDFIANMKSASQSVTRFRDEFRSAFEGLAGSADKPKGAFNALNRSLLSTQKEMRDILAVGGRVPDELAIKYRTLKSSIDQVNGSFRETRNQASPATGIVGGFGSSLIGAAAGALSLSTAISAVRTALTITSDFQRMDASLRAVSSSTQDFSRAQAFLRATADQYGLSLQSLSQSYVGFKANTNDTILKGKEAERIFLSVAKSSAALQLSTEDTTGVLRAFGQMLSKGTVQSEELKGQIGERLYNAFGMAAKAMGVTTMQLNKMLESGEVLSVDLLPKLATELEKTNGAAAQKNLETMNGQWNRATNELSLFISEFSKTAGIDTFFTEIGKGIANTTRGMRDAIQSKEWGTFMMGIGSLASKAIAYTTPTGLLSYGANFDSAAATTKGVDAAKTDQFRTMEASARASLIKAQTTEVEALEKRVAKSRGLTSRQGDANREALKQAQDLLRAYKGINIQLTGREGLEKRKEQSVLSGLIPPPSTFQKLESDLSKLKTRILDLRAAGKTSEADALIGKYKALEKQIAAIGNPFDKVKTSKPKGQATWGEKMRRDLKAVEDLIKEFQAKNPTLEVPFFLKLQKGYYQDNLQIHDMVKLPKLSPVQTTLERDLAGLDSTLQPLSEKVSLKGAAIFNRTIERTKALIANNGSRANSEQVNLLSGIISEEQIAAGVAQLTQMTKGGLSGFQENMAALLEFPKDQQDRVLGGWIQLGQGISAALTGAANDAAVGMGELIGGMLSGATSLASLPALFGGILGDLAQNIGKAMIAFGTSGIALKSLMANPVTAIAAGIGLVALGAVLKNSVSKSIGKATQPTAFAAGGIISGTTYAMMGEYARAKSDPEVVAPLSKLASIIRPMIQPKFSDRGVIQNVNVNGFSDGQIVGRLSGSNIDLVYSRTQKAKREFN